MSGAPIQPAELSYEVSARQLLDGALGLEEANLVPLEISTPVSDASDGWQFVGLLNESRILAEYVSALVPSDALAVEAGSALDPLAPAQGSQRPTFAMQHHGAAVVRVNASDGIGLGKDVAIVATSCNAVPALNISRLLERSDLVSVVDVAANSIPRLNFSIEAIDIDSDEVLVQWVFASHAAEVPYAGPGSGDISQLAGDEPAVSLELLAGPDSDHGVLRLVGNGTA